MGKLFGRTEKGIDEMRLDRMKFILKNSKGKVLDCGGWEGQEHKIILKHFPDAVCVDKNMEADYQADFNKDKLPFLDGKFDTIVAGEVVEHLYNLPFFINECKRVLKKNGRLIITTPNARGLSSFIGGIVGRYNPNHVMMFDKGTLANFMKEMGFSSEIEFCNSFDVYNYPWWTRPVKYLTFVYPPWRLHVCAVCKKTHTLRGWKK